MENTVRRQGKYCREVVHSSESPLSEVPLYMCSGGNNE